MAKVRDMLSDKSKENLYKITKQILNKRKDIKIRDFMKHDSYKRINRRIKQVRWGK